MMGAQFTSASSTQLINSAPVLVSTGYPLTMACWFMPISLAAQGILIGFANSSADTSLHLRTNTAGAATTVSRVSSTETTAVSTVNVASGNWSFAISRFITSTNRWISQLCPTGTVALISHVQVTTSAAPTGLNQVAMGVLSSSFAIAYNGLVAEAWYCDADIQPSLSAATALDNGLFLKLAYEGPFSVPMIADKIVEYRSLYNNLESARDQYIDGYNYSRTGRPSWTMSATAPVLTFHPPLSTHYASLTTLKPRLMAV